ncbi:MAG TPA: metallophosphoesterase family protein [Nocardioidaceae bacterium]|nr:metallophosphoesterase family protein [Nocardioidaceae bacterium]
MTETHFEPFLHLVDVTHDRALIAWGGFYFQRADAEHQWRVVDDEQLSQLDQGRTGSIGASSEPYGEAAVEAYDETGALAAHAATRQVNHVWLEGLAPDTTYTYQVVVDGQPWADGERWDWGPGARGGLDLGPRGRSYRRRFRTHPSPDVSVPLRFSVLGDFGVGVIADAEPGRRQRRVAAALDRLVTEHGVRLVLTVGDNVYKGEPGRVEQESGNDDDDWYSKFYAPYRYLLGEIPVYPAVGNHDTGETETSDEPDQIADIFHTRTRFDRTDVDGRAAISVGLNYRFGYGADVEFTSIDTTETPGGLRGNYYFQYAEHSEFLDHAFPQAAGPRWRIPFCHHPAYCAGPKVENNAAVLDRLVPLFQRAGVRVAFAGHEHNFQISQVDGIAYVTTGAGGKVREQPPTEFAAAGTQAWGMQAHCLLVDVTRDRMAITPVAALGADGELELMSALGPDDTLLRPPFEVSADERV